MHLLRDHRRPQNVELFCSYHILTSSVYGLLTKCEVKIAGYWPSFFFFFGAFTNRDGVEVYKLAKIRTKTISSHLDRAHLVNKGLIIWLSGKCSCGTLWVLLSRYESSILRARVANHSPRFDLSCPLAELAI